MTSPDIKLFRFALGALVKHLRDKHELTQEALGVRLGVQQAFIAKIERGSNGLPAEKYVVLARVFGMKIDKFHKRVEDIVEATRRAANAIKPGSLDTVDPRGLVRFVVALLIT